MDGRNVYEEIKIKSEKAKLKEEITQKSFE
jgi:hypothetical protein